MKDVTPSNGKSPNAEIDKAIKKLMQDMEKDGPLDVKVKVISVAINWEKVKHHIVENGDSDLDASLF
jgi:hypothetical protein